MTTNAECINRNRV